MVSVPELTVTYIEQKFYVVIVLGKLEDAVFHFPAGTVHKKLQSMKHV
jgi:hypothetical protein